MSGIGETVIDTGGKMFAGVWGGTGAVVQQTGEALQDQFREQKLWSEAQLDSLQNGLNWWKMLSLVGCAITFFSFFVIVGLTWNHGEILSFGMIFLTMFAVLASILCGMLLWNLTEAYANSYRGITLRNALVVLVFLVGAAVIGLLLSINSGMVWINDCKTFNASAPYSTVVGMLQFASTPALCQDNVKTNFYITSWFNFFGITIFGTGMSALGLAWIILYYLVHWNNAVALKNAAIKGYNAIQDNPTYQNVKETLRTALKTESTLAGYDADYVYNAIDTGNQDQLMEQAVRTLGEGIRAEHKIHSTRRRTHLHH